jgi:hypothetical protein
MRHLVDIELVAFPQVGLLRDPGALDLIDHALGNGADVMGGLDPSLYDRDPVEHLDQVFAMCERHQVGADIHLHERGDAGWFTMDLILERVDPGLAARGTPSALDLRERSMAAVLAARDDFEARQEALHRLAHDLTAAGRIMHEYGGTPNAGATGVLESINASRGGVPKSPVLEAEVDRHGLRGDRQHNRRHHGRPWQALSLWSLDVIAMLRAEGHPVSPGSC